MSATIPVVDSTFRPETDEEKLARLERSRQHFEGKKDQHSRRMEFWYRKKCDHLRRAMRDAAAKAAQ